MVPKLLKCNKGDRPNQFNNVGRHSFFLGWFFNSCFGIITHFIQHIWWQKYNLNQHKIVCWFLMCPKNENTDQFNQFNSYQARLSWFFNKVAPIIVILYNTCDDKKQIKPVWDGLPVPKTFWPNQVTTFSWFTICQFYTTQHIWQHTNSLPVITQLKPA